MNCRFCGHPLSHRFLDLGTAPPSNAFLRPDQLASPEAWYPLQLFVCDDCLLVQVPRGIAQPELFPDDYAYFSSYSRTWLAHASDYVDLARTRLGLDADSFVVELASNDGYLLQYLVQAGVPCLGVEPTRNTAAAARVRGVPTVERFFGEAAARDLRASHRPADLIVANNVLAHVPEPNDFIAGIAVLLADAGTVTIEFPHLLRLVAGRQFDTVYHEHYSYFTLHAVQRMLGAHGLAVHDVQALLTHGGSLRIWAAHAAAGLVPSSAVADVLAAEAEAGLRSVAGYGAFQRDADAVKDDFLRFLLDERAAGRRVVAYGAAAKGNTLLNYAGVRGDLLAFVADASPHKQGLHLPGSRIPVVTESQLLEAKPDVVVILPWNLRDEIEAQLAPIRAWGGRFAVAVPRLEVW